MFYEKNTDLRLPPEGRGDVARLPAAAYRIQRLMSRANCCGSMGFVM